MILLIGMPLVGEDAKTVETPFGPVSRSAKKPRPLADDPNLKIEENGDAVTFKRRTPFGEQVWRTKRSELSAVEKQMMAARAEQSGR